MTVSKIKFSAQKRDRLTVANRDKLASTPDKTVLLNTPHALLKSLHVSLVIPRLDLESDDRLGNLEGLTSSKLLLLLGLLSFVVLSNTFGLDPLSLVIGFLIVRAEKVNLIVLLAGSSSGTGRGRREGVGAGGKGVKLVGKRGNVGVPPVTVREGGLGGYCREGEVNICMTSTYPARYSPEPRDL